MFDAELRRVKDILLEPVVAAAAALHLSPGRITAVGMLFGLTAAGAAAAGQWTLAVVLWCLNRIADGLDGLVARRFSVESDTGGYLDIMADFVVYAAIPLGVASGASAGAALAAWIWPSTAVLLAVFYVNAASWLYASALIEKQRSQVPLQQTSLAMPRGIIEGAETILFFTLLLLMPGYIVPINIVFAALTGATALLRVILTLGGLK